MTLRGKISTYAIPGVVKAQTIQDIKIGVAQYFNIPVKTLDKNTRKREIVQPRQIAMFFSLQARKGSLATIGNEIGKKDHATVLHAKKNVMNLYDTDKIFRNYIQELGSILGIELKLDK